MIHLCRGIGFRDSGQRDLAIAAFSEAIRIKQDFAQAVCFRGLEHDAAGDQELAIVDDNQAIFLSPAFLKSAGTNRAVAYLHKRDYKGALANFSELIAQDPANRAARIFRGATYMLMGKNERALADFDDYSRRNPQAALGLYGRGLVELRSGDADGAVNKNQYSTPQSSASIAAAKLLNPNVAALWAREIGAPPMASAAGLDIPRAKSTARIPQAD